MIDQKISCDGCGEKIEEYDPSPTWSHIHTTPIPYKHSGMVHAVYITPEPQQDYCKECWFKMKKALNKR